MTALVTFGTAAFAVQVVSAMQMDNMFFVVFFFFSFNPEVSLQMKMLIASSF